MSEERSVDKQEIVTKEEYDRLKTAYDFYHAERERIFPGVNGFTPEMLAQLPTGLSNDEITAIELYEWITDPPERYFLYIERDQYTGSLPGVRLSRGRATTWTGALLGRVFIGRSYRSNFGDERAPVRITGTNGVRYYGTWYIGVGTYARVKRLKNE